MFTKVRSEKGFTLIELLIVVAIIGILAAVAIPQFAAYRIRGFNSAAASDLRNTKTAQESLFADWQGYGPSTGAIASGNPQVWPGGTGGAGTLCAGPPAAGNIFGVSMDDRNGTAQGIQIAVSSGVNLVATTDAAVAPTLPGSYVVASKHTNGDTAFATDGDTTAIYRDVVNFPVATPLAAGDEGASTAQFDDLSGVGNWVAM